MAVGQTKLSNLINPQVMADIIRGKVESKIRVIPFAKIDSTLQGVPGDTITVPTYAYIGDAEDVAEGVEAGTTVLTATTTKATIKKAMKAVELTDEAILSGYGDPVGEVNNQLALSIASKVDSDAMNAMLSLTGGLNYDGSASVIDYNGVVKAVDKFGEEVNGQKVMFVNPAQITSLRLDPNFISNEKYNADVMMKGEIGMIANTRIVPSKKVVLDTTKAFYVCPIIKIEADEETEATEQEAPAITVYLKRDVNVETERHTLKRTTAISADEFYTVAVSNSSKLVLAKYKAAP